MTQTDLDPGSKGFDTLSCEVAQHRLARLAEEGGIRAARSAGNAFVSNSGSVASAIFTRDGLLVAQTLSGQQHVSALHMMMPEILVKYPAAEMREGDVFLCNDQFRGGIHPTDLAMFRPIFHDGKVAFFSGILMIVADLGGVSMGGLPATATDVFHEGVVIPPVRIAEAGVVNDSVITLILGNSRVPEKLRTDVDALVGAGAVVAQRLEEMIARYGLAHLNEIIKRLLDHSETLVRDGIARIPDGEYTGSYLAEDDGVDAATPSYLVKVRIKVEGTEVLVDFTGSADQAAGAINSSLSQSLSFVAYTLRYYLDPQIALNEGFYRPIKTIFPLGSVVNPRFPAACNLRFSVGQAMADAMHAALRPVFPERSVAPSSGIASVNAMAAKVGQERRWAMFDVLFGPGGGRTGVEPNDGQPFQMIGVSGYMPAVEYYETVFPVIYEHYGFVPDSAGPGRWRGGAGIYKDIRFLEDSIITLRGVDRMKFSPEGVDGGVAGRGGGWTVNPGSPDATTLPAKLTNHHLKAGDVLRESVAGGGGYGPPLLRDPEVVATDVRGGIVSHEGAARDYGVVVTPEGRVDESATRELRLSRKES